MNPKRHTGRRPSARIRGAEHPSDHSEAERLAKYSALVKKYDQLVRRYEASVARRSEPLTLALAVLRQSTRGYALFRNDGFVSRNERWLDLVRRRGPWRMLEVGVDEVRVRGIHLHIEGLARDLARELLAEEAPRACTARTAPDDRDEVIELRMERVDTDGKRLVFVVADDVTERVRTEREMARARDAVLAHERMRLLGELASGVAHDLNNTLHALSLRLGHLGASPLDDRQRETVAVLNRICADAAERVSRLQELGRRREDVPTEWFEVATVIEEALAVARSEIDERAHVRGVSFDIHTDIAPGIRAVGSAGEIRHAFLNLLLNARDAMPKGGRIRISSRLQGDDVEIDVEDEGIGIPAGDVDRVFDPFFTTKGAHGMGMGLGLAIVQGVMHRLGGDVSVSNRSGGGAVFTLTFPMAPPAAAEAPPQDGPVPRGHRLLVVDDDTDNLEATKCVLEDLGQNVDLAASGAEALAFLAEGRRYDLVLCDMGMPQLNGWQVAEEMKRIAPGMRVVLLTGWAQEISPDDPRRSGVDAIVGKPLEIAHLRRILRQWLGAGGEAR